MSILLEVDELTYRTLSCTRWSQITGTDAWENSWAPDISVFLHEDELRQLSKFAWINYPFDATVRRYLAIKRREYIQSQIIEAILNKEIDPQLVIGKSDLHRGIDARIYLWRDRFDVDFTTSLFWFKQKIGVIPLNTKSRKVIIYTSSRLIDIFEWRFNLSIEEWNEANTAELDAKEQIMMTKIYPQDIQVSVISRPWRMKIKDHFPRHFVKSIKPKNQDNTPEQYA